MTVRRSISALALASAAALAIASPPAAAAATPAIPTPRASSAYPRADPARLRGAGDA